MHENVFALEDINEALFWEKVDENGPISDYDGEPCWMWIASKRHGYGQFRIGRYMIAAPRVAWVIYTGKYPKGLDVLHRCDNPPCVKRTHLFTGTHQDNIADATAKGRMGLHYASPASFKNGHIGYGRSLQNTDVLMIRMMIAEGMSNVGIGRIYGVDPSVISHIRHNKKYREVV